MHNSYYMTCKPYDATTVYVFFPTQCFQLKTLFTVGVSGEENRLFYSHASVVDFNQRVGTLKILNKATDGVKHAEHEEHDDH